jgi:hypothetical protein
LRASEIGLQAILEAFGELMPRLKNVEVGIPGHITNLDNLLQYDLPGRFFQGGCPGCEELWRHRGKGVPNRYRVSRFLLIYSILCSSVRSDCSKPFKPSVPPFEESACYCENGIAYISRGWLEKDIVLDLETFRAGRYGVEEALWSEAGVGELGLYHHGRKGHYGSRRWGEICLV